MAVAQKISMGLITQNPRQRVDYPEDETLKLADSIQRTRGLLEPVVLDPSTNELIAGGRRMRGYAVLMLRADKDRELGRFVPEDGWMQIPFVYKGMEGEDEEEIKLFKQVCELEENLARLDLQWWEKAAAIAAINEAQKRLAEKRGGKWTLRDTAEMTGLSLGTVQQSIELIREAEKRPELKEKENLVSALRSVKTEKQLAQRKEEIELKQAGTIMTFPAEIIVGDARELIDLEPDEEYDAIVTNFPFGVEYGYSGKAEALYKDDEAYIVDLVRSVVKKSHRVLKDQSWFVGFFDIRKATYSNPMAAFFQRVKSFMSDIAVHESISPSEWSEITEMGHKAMGLAHWFEEAGYSYVRMMPLIWAKPNKMQGNIGDPRKGMVTAYEAAIIAAKGDAVLLKQGRNDLFVFDTLNPSERDFEMQMPLGLCKEVISLVAMGKSRILDPFAGVGSFGEGALENQCSFKGFELNPERAATGNLRLQEHIFAKVGL